jgi:outer membrane receptor protein involved in Fe transport
MRAPTAIEVTCADPEAPCRLPNQVLADPPRKPVRARSGELGVRTGGRTGGQGAALSWRGSAALFRVDLDDDIQFVSAGGAATNAGFFRNVGRTQRQGAELTAQLAAGRFALEASWLQMKATYRDPFTAFSPNNSSADANGDIAVEPGARLPGIPKQVVKLRFGWESGSGHAAGLSLQRYGARFARGDENNGDGNGPLSGYTLAHLDGSLQVARGWQLLAQVRNLFDRTYQSGGVIGANFFAGPDRSFLTPSVPEAFRTPGAPRSYWLGVRYSVE